MTVYIPGLRSAYVFRVVSRVNRGFEVFEYGLLPIAAGTSLPCLDGGTVSVPANGVLPARSIVSPGIEFPAPSFIEANVKDKTNMWFIPADWRDTLFHIKMFVRPAFIKVDLEVPRGVRQLRFQRDAIIGAEYDAGFKRGFIEVVQLPELRYAYRFCNETNLSVYESHKWN